MATKGTATDENRDAKNQAEQVIMAADSTSQVPSGKTAFQVACMIQGERIREAYPTKAEAETRAAQIRQMVDNEGAAAFSLPAASASRRPSASRS